MDLDSSRGGVAGGDARGEVGEEVREARRWRVYMAAAPATVAEVMMIGVGIIFGCLEEVCVVCSIDRSN